MLTRLLPEREHQAEKSQVQRPYMFCHKLYMAPLLAFSIAEAAKTGDSVRIK